jgi:hypothetical protein
MIVTIVKSNATVPTIPGDNIPSPDTLFLYSVYQNVPFSIDLTFSLEDDADPANTVPVNINSVSSSLSDFNSVTFSTIDSDPLAYKIRVSGTITDAIPGEYYNILNKDYQIVQVPASPSPVFDYLGIVRWGLPVLFQTLISNKYDFVLNYTGGSETVEMSQYVYWGYDPAITQFKQVVSEGEL